MYTKDSRVIVIYFPVYTVQHFCAMHQMYLCLCVCMCVCSEDSVDVCICVPKILRRNLCIHYIIIKFKKEKEKKNQFAVKLILDEEGGGRGPPFSKV